DRRDQLEQGAALRRQEPLFLVVHQEMRVELRVRGHRKRAIEFLFELVALADSLEVDRQSMAACVLAERIDAFQQNLEEPLRLLGTAVAVVDGMRHDDVRPRAEARERVDEGEAVQARIRVDVAGHRDGEGGPRAIGDVVHDEFPHALERLVRVDAQPKAMGEDVQLFRERFSDRLRRRQLERPSTPGREWRAYVGVVRRLHEALKQILLEAMARTAVARRPEKIQFNIRVDGEVLARFRDYCRRNGLDPQGQVVLFMRKVLDTEFDFQERLWSALREERS